MTPLSQLRRARGISLRDLARLTKINHSRLWNLEHPPREQELERLAKVFGVPVESL